MFIWKVFRRGAWQDEDRTTIWQDRRPVASHLSRFLLIEISFHPSNYSLLTYWNDEVTEQIIREYLTSRQLMSSQTVRRIISNIWFSCRNGRTNAFSFSFFFLFFPREMSNLSSVRKRSTDLNSRDRYLIDWINRGNRYSPSLSLSVFLMDGYCVIYHHTRTTSRVAMS